MSDMDPHIRPISLDTVRATRRIGKRRQSSDNGANPHAGNRHKHRAVEGSLDDNSLTEVDLETYDDHGRSAGHRHGEDHGPEDHIDVVV